MEQKNKAASELEPPKRHMEEGLASAHSLPSFYHGPDQKSMLDNYFTEIRERVPAIDAARFYGMEFSRDGKKALCPFHNDRHPSLSFYRGGFKCFACGASGSSLDLTMQLHNLDLKGAAARLNADFNLGLDRTPTAAERDAARRVQDARRMFMEWRDQMLNRLDAAIRTANLADEANPTDAEALAIRYRETLIYWSDILLHAPLDEQMQVFRDRKEIEAICNKILNNTPTKSKTA